MSAVDDAKKYLSFRPPMENKRSYALHPDVLVDGLLGEIERLRKIVIRLNMVIPDDDYALLPEEMRKTIEALAEKK